MDIPFGRPWITDDDRRAVLDVLDGPILTHGPRGKTFEAAFQAFMQGGHALSVSSCMAALHISYLHLGVGPGDEVIVPAQTHVATVHAVEWTGATPVFADCDPRTGNVAPDEVARRITSRTKAIGIVHFLGIPCDMDAIMDLAWKHRLSVVEDCALAVGARYDGVHVGLIGDMGCFSFYPVKHLTTGEGGMFVTKDPEAIPAVSLLRAFGVDRDHTARKLPGEYDVVRLGLNYRMSEMQAALGISQLARMEEALSVRARNFARLQAGLEEIAGVRVLDTTDAKARQSHYCLGAVLEGPLTPERDRIVRSLGEAGVGTSVYYPRPVPLMTYYKRRYQHTADDFPNASALSRASIALPVGPHVSTEGIDHIIETFSTVTQEVLA